jgi:histidinol-phosphate aminotransferase
MTYISPYHGLNNDNVLRLATNENSHELCMNLVSDLQKKLPYVNRYPNVINDILQENIAKKHFVDKENIIIGSGSDELIVLAAMLYIERGNNALMCSPSFFRYAQVTKLMHGECKMVKCINYKYNLNGLLDNIDPFTRIIFICNPNNPTGTFIKTMEIEQFLARVPNNILVIVDEAYFDFVFPKTHSASVLINKYHNLLVLRTFSKFYALAGLRIGFGISNKDVIVKFVAARSQYSVNAIAQEAALAVLNLPDEYFDNYYKEIVEEREYLYLQLDSLSVHYYQSQANFIFVNFGGKCKEIIDGLRHGGVIVRPCAMFNCPTFARITIGTHSENEKVIYILSKLLNKLI